MTTQQYCLIGSPIERSPSPAMHNAAFAACGLDAQYRLRPAAHEDVPQVLSELLRGQWAGMNITTPLKAALVQHVELDALAEQAGAINTIKVVSENGERKLLARLTDVDGVAQPLANRQHLGGSALLLGAGGAARAAAIALSLLQTKVHVAARRTTAAGEVLAVLPPASRGAVLDLSSNAVNRLLPKVDVVIQATPVGRHGEAFDVDWSFLRSGVIAFEMLYHPPSTPFLLAAHASGCECIEGWEMLLHQGMVAWEWWTGKKAPKDVMQAALLQHLQNQLSD